MGREPRREESWDLARDINAARAALSDALGADGSAIPAEIDVWRAYARTEGTAAKLKYRLGSERPGMRSALPEVERPRELITSALAQLDEAAATARDGRLDEALESLRLARTSLRAYLADLEKVRRRERRLARKASPSKRASSPSS